MLFSLAMAAHLTSSQNGFSAPNTGQLTAKGKKEPDRSISILVFHVTSQAFPYLGVHRLGVPQSVKCYDNSLCFFAILKSSVKKSEFYMDVQGENTKSENEILDKCVPVLSEYAKTLESHIKKRYVEKISLVGIDPSSIPSEEYDPECLPRIEATDLVSYLVLETSYYTKQQFKAFKSLEAYNQMVSGFVTSVRGRIVSGKHVVVAKVRHSQRMNDPLVNIWLIAESDGTILSSHCLGCKAGLAKSCSHIASVLFNIEAWTRIHGKLAWTRIQGKLACTQVKCTWLLPTYVNEVPYARVKDIDFTSAKNLKEKMDMKIDSLEALPASSKEQMVPRGATSSSPSVKLSEMTNFYDQLNKCAVKPVALSLIGPYADNFVVKSRNVPVVSDLYQTKNLDIQYPELLKKWLFLDTVLAELVLLKVGAVFHSNLAQPPQSLQGSVQ